MTDNNFKQCQVTCFNEEKISQIKKELPERSKIQPTAEIFKAMGHPIRLSILFILTQSKCCVCDIVNTLDQPVSTISQHLRTLKHAGLIQNEQKGKWVYYSHKYPELFTGIWMIDLLKQLSGNFKGA